MTTPKWSNIFFLSWLLLNFSYAQELSMDDLYFLSLSDLQEIEIASGYSLSIDAAPANATILSAEDIAAMGALTLWEVLESIPGIHIQPSLLTSSLDVLSIRGVYTHRGPQTLFMLNGQKISADVSSSTLPDTGIINIKNISRIEVVRGPGSAIYGADAFSGVVNIITKSAQEINGTHIGMRGGALATKNIWLQHSGKVANNWDLVAMFEMMKQDADRSRTINTDAQTQLDALLGSNASLAPGYIDRRYQSTAYNIHLLNPSWKITLDGWLHSDLGLGSGIAHAIDYDGQIDIEQVLFGIQYRNTDWFEDVEFRGHFNYQYINQEYQLNIFPPGNLSLIGADGNLFTSPYIPVSFTEGVIGHPSRTSKVPKIDLTFLYTGIKNNTWRLNFGILKEDFSAQESKNFGPGVLDGSQTVVDGNLTDVSGTAHVYLPDKHRNVKYLSLQNEWQIDPDWTLTAGLRYDHYSDFGGTINPRVALVWKNNDHLTTKFLYGRAFRAPNFAELHAQNNPVTIGNKELEPETINTWEVLFAYQPIPGLQANLGIYHFQADEMIEFIDNGASGNVAQNYNRLEGRGVELEASWNLNPEWFFKAAFNYQRVDNKYLQQPQPYIADKQFYLDARWRFKPDWLLTTQLQWLGKRERERHDSRKKLDDYLLLNLTLRSINIAKHWDLSATVKNLFNHDIREPSDVVIPEDYPMNQRQAYVELSYKF